MLLPANPADCYYLRRTVRGISVTKRIIAASTALAITIGCAQAQAPTVPHFTLLHSFGSSGDGQWPLAGLVVDQGALYGTTQYGGASGGGTVFKLTPPTNKNPNWTETVLYSFCSQANCNDGLLPYADLILYQGALYGTTNEGGASGNCVDGCGTVFKLTP
jgi:uncharacterized repeat protein (TIGR03803 family)